MKKELALLIIKEFGLKEYQEIKLIDEKIILQSLTEGTTTHLKVKDLIRRPYELNEEYILEDEYIQIKTINKSIYETFKKAYEELHS